MEEDTVRDDAVDAELGLDFFHSLTQLLLSQLVVGPGLLVIDWLGLRFLEAPVK